MNFIVKHFTSVTSKLLSLNYKIFKINRTHFLGHNEICVNNPINNAHKNSGCCVTKLRFTTCLSLYHLVFVYNVTVTGQN